MHANNIIGAEPGSPRLAASAGERTGLPGGAAKRARAAAAADHLGSWRMPQTWVWMQIAIVVFVVIGMIVAITKLA
jgi:hypothetical protein